MIKKLEKPPIKEVVIGIKFSKKIFDLDYFENIYNNSFKKEYPQKENTVRINITQNKFKETYTKAEQTGIRIKDIENNSDIILEVDRIALIKKEPYYQKGGDELIEEFLKILCILKDKVSYKAIEDFGLKYVNFIQIEKGQQSEFFTIKETLNTKNTDLKTDNFVEKYVLKNETQMAIINLSKKPNRNLIDIIFDIDVHTYNFIKDQDDILKNFKVLRKLKNKIFFNNFPKATEMEEFKNDR